MQPEKNPSQESPKGAEARFQRLYRILRNRICLLDYPPGARLGEEALAAEFGVSRTPLRRVLVRLEADGLLKSVQGVGTMVTDVDLPALGHVYQLRMELAVLIGRLAPAPAGPDCIDRFRTLGDRVRALADSPEARSFAELNMEFFHALMGLTGSEPLREACERLYYRTARIWLKSIPRMDLAEEIAVFGREISEVLAAVEAGDIDAVGHIRRAHISMSLTRLRRQIGRTADLR